MSMPASMRMPITPQEAGEKLARLMEKQLGYPEGHIDNIALRLFIRAYWSQVTTLAHVIHDESRPPPTPAEFGEMTELVPIEPRQMPTTDIDGRPKFMAWDAISHCIWPKPDRRYRVFVK